MFQSAMRSSVCFSAVSLSVVLTFGQLLLHRSAVSSSLRSKPFRRFLSQESRAKIQAAITEYPVVVFMKGNPEDPMCGFSRGVVKILSTFDIPPEKFKAYDVLRDAELRSGIKEFS
jgi:monothiol glutaredoxin